MFFHLFWGFVLVLICVIILLDARKPYLFPPGPIWWPIVGSFPQIRAIHIKKKYQYLVWAHLREIYGSIFGLKLGRSRVVVVSGYEAVKKVSCCDVFQGRPDGFFFRLRSFGQRLGLVFVDGPFLQEQRKFCMNVLRKLGMGTISMNDTITNEVQEVVQQIRSKCEDGPIEVQQLFGISTLNVLWIMLAGYRFCLDNEKLTKLLCLVHKAFHLVDMSGGLLNQIPFLRFVAPNASGYNATVAIVDEIMRFLQDVIQERSSADGDDFVSVFLREINKNKDNRESNFTEKQLIVLLEDFFMAGSETTTSTIMFAIFFLIKYPEIQAKIHNELDQVVGLNQTPSMKHRSMLVYLDATIMEVQRYSSPVPIAIPHVATNDAELMGYRIPKGTLLLPSLWSVHMDASHWKNPFTFSPDRFIDENGTIIQDNHFMPFGIGKRKCIGELLAKSVIFCFLANLLQHFKLESPVENLKPVILDGITLGLEPFKVRFVPRTVGE